jgi:hypothetical protein
MERATDKNRTTALRSGTGRCAWGDGGVGCSSFGVRCAPDCWNGEAAKDTQQGQERQEPGLTREDVLLGALQTICGGDRNTARRLLGNS